MLKKSVGLLLLAFTLYACNLPSYVFDNKTQTTGVDFTQGKWLLNTIDAPDNVQDKLTQLARTDFAEKLDDRLSYIPETKGLLLPPKIGFQPTKAILENLKKGTQYDYLINIKAAQTRNDFGAIDLTPHRLTHDAENSNKVILEIYDLNTQQILYSQKVMATVRTKKDKQYIHLSKPSYNLIVGAYKKLIKDIDKKSLQK